MFGLSIFHRTPEIQMPSGRIATQASVASMRVADFISKYN
jgi:hypothetical protein